MNIAAILALAQMLTPLVQAGLVTIQQIKNIWHHTGMTEEQMNTVLDWVNDDAARRKAQRDLDAAEPAPPAA